MSELKWKLEGDLWDLVKAEVLAYWASVQDKYADGKITLQEIWELVAEAIEALTRIFEGLNVDNATKRRMLLEAIDDMYVQVIAPLNISYVPDVFEPFVDRMIGRVVHAMAVQALNYLLPDSIAPAPDSSED